MRFGRWKHLGDSISKKLESGDKVIALLNSPFSHRTSHYLHLFITLVFVSLSTLLVWHLDLVGPSKPAIMPGEIDLSGKWKINYSDNPKFADPKLDDSKWCEVGVPDPKLGNPQVREGCPDEIYPVEKMQNSTFWYRKWVEIPDGTKWNEPSLFLGAIKHKAWVYWNNELIGITSSANGTGIANVILDPQNVRPQKYLLAIRVQAQTSKYPGIFHAYKRGIAVGENQSTNSQFQNILNTKYIFPALNCFVQFSGLLLTLLLLCMGRGNGTEFFWLAVYFSTTFASSALNAFGGNNPELNRSLFWSLLGFSGIGVLGYSLKFHSLFKTMQTIFSRILIGMLLTSAALVYTITKSGNFYSQKVTVIFITLSIVPFVLISISAINSLFIFTTQKSNRNFDLGALASVSILFVSHLLNAVPPLLYAQSPVILANPAMKSLLSVMLVISMIYQYTKQERMLAFYGRFIRPGLKDLLHDSQKKKNFGDQKLFRARQIAIMKVDIVGHTETTFQMPYGMKRLFQDTWFSIIDKVVADRTFLDKNVGDGSVYCFTETHKDGACGSAIIAAQMLREAVKEFDLIYQKRLMALLEITPELAKPAEAFFRSYQERTGTPFPERSTKVRIGLVYGFVDEGLWGQASQSHYDVQGDLVSLAARVEAKARVNEILLDGNFLQKLESEMKGSGKMIKAQGRSETLKGMGATELYSFEEISAALLAAS